MTAIHYSLVSSLKQAEILRVLRNMCCSWLTNYRDEIGIEQQEDWFHNQYIEASEQGRFRAYLFYDDAGDAVGYGALRLQDGQLHITECVDAGRRGEGYGRAILEVLVEISRREDRDLIAEIWATNTVSIRLHKQAGFTLVTSRRHMGAELQIFHLATNLEMRF